jgi:hypothetical protein
MTAYASVSADQPLRIVGSVGKNDYEEEVVEA